eukprot:CAMPEP_0197536008 /NCGR_PEP_ID=MMETSP1318-20131121/52577_1 /TAXON_ID=552666 /ORGANISM="Partenskyella glossopodia, Strain RCC365" /LENGTH=210 /DNA_ID=CAMNT_0043093773 /DNA_START=225 /DNA_END=857 /DNA_ORIENTATION=+
MQYKEGKIDIQQYKKLAIEYAESKISEKTADAEKFRQKFGEAMAERMGVPLDRIIIEKVSAENPNEDIKQLLEGNGKGIKVDFAIKPNPDDPQASVMAMASQGGPGPDFNIADVLRLSEEQQNSFAQVYESMKEQGKMGANALDFAGLSRVLGNIEPKLSGDQQAILVNMGLQINAMQPEKGYFDPDDDLTVRSDPAKDLQETVFSEYSN